MVLGDFPDNSIVNIDGRWGVLCINYDRLGVRRYRTVDFWEGGRESVPDDVLAEGLPDDDDD
jgi:hypothetical protein